MEYFDPHIHMVSRTTDDYETLAKMGCVGMSEPAFWAGFDRGSAEGFRDYFRQLTEFEPKFSATLKRDLERTVPQAIPAFNPSTRSKEDKTVDAT